MNGLQLVPSVTTAMEEGECNAMADERPVGEKRIGPAAWVPYVAVCISLFSMLLGPCFGAAVAVVGNYVAKQQDVAVAAEQHRQDSEKLTGISAKVEEISKQNIARIPAETKMQSDLEHLITDEQKDRHDIEENAKIMQTYGALIQGKRK